MFQKRSITKTITVTACLLLAALVLAGGASAQGLSAQGLEKAAPPLFQKEIEIYPTGAAGVMRVKVLASEAEDLARYSGTTFRVEPIYEEPEVPDAAREDGRPLSRPGISVFDGWRRTTRGAQLVVDTSSLELPEGAVGFRIGIGRAEGPSGNRIATRKTTTWVVHPVTYYGGDRIGIEAVLRCNQTTMKTYYSQWETIFAGLIFCPDLYPHGAELLAPGSTTRIEVGFDNAYHVIYKTWKDGKVKTWDWDPYEYINLGGA